MDLHRWILARVALAAGAALVAALGCTPMPGGTADLTGDATRGQTLFANGDGTRPGCENCHCPDATGGCGLGAPNIQGEPLSEIDAKIRNANVDHPGGKFNFADQDVADIAAYLASLGSPG